jgi:ectoine hydroxylase-related dioxygenase (phytanoyl-CoA dioxygenase family)
MTDRFHLTFPFAVVVNIYLVDVDENNGATEFWPGTHYMGIRNLTKSHELEEPFIMESALEERRKMCPPLRPFVPKGSLVLRDLRIWHCGVPNIQTVPRIMLTLVCLLSLATELRFILPSGIKIRCA